MNVNPRYKSRVWILGLARISHSMSGENAKILLEAKLGEFDIHLNDNVVAVPKTTSPIMLIPFAIHSIVCEVLSSLLLKIIYYECIV